MTLLTGLVFLTSCAGHLPCKQADGRGACPNGLDNPESDKNSAVLWFEYAAEARALYYQAFNIAQDRLDTAIANGCPCDKMAVILDIDETLLDNSPYQAYLIGQGKGYTPKSWQDWTQQAQSKDLPGAKSFLQHAAACKVNIFYLSNRSTNAFEVTEKNLEARGFPMVDQQHLLLQLKHEGKEPHRDYIGTNYQVVLLMGDNLDDFSSIFDTNSVSARFDITDKNQDQFGRKFIVLPNPMYGDWETALYSTQVNSKPTEEEKVEIRKLWLKHLELEYQPTN